jgi:hypothetical protein
MQQIGAAVGLAHLAFLGFPQWPGTSACRA